MTIEAQNTPLVSVLMPAFNAECFIRESIESVLIQTYPHFELLILDDGSTDKTYVIASSFKDSRIQVLRHEQNQGLVASRNDLVNAANGQYIAFLDSDDIAKPDRLAIQVNALETGSIDICGSEYSTLYEETGKVKKSKQLYSNADIRAMMVVACPLCNPSIMGKAIAFKSHPYESTVDVGEDYALWQKLSLAGYRFTNIPKNLLIYRVHHKQISQQKRLQTESADMQHQNQYLLGLGISPQLRPRPLSWRQRLAIGPVFLMKLNGCIPGISVKANYQIYARFQKRGGGIWTLFTRTERLFIALLASFRGAL